ncbi:glucosamine-6-phosphate deaminase [Fredinandcohnia humi]
MKIIAVENYQEMSKAAAQFIINQVKEKPQSVLGLATGGTVLGTYEKVIEDYQQNKTSYKQVHSVNLDEYIGVEATHPNSYHYYMMEHLFAHIDIERDHIHIPNGLAKNTEEECRNYEGVIEELGGVDLQLLGIGVNGHIGFNEPGTSFDSVTHVVKLTESTRDANKRYFNRLEDVPTHAITMGISTIMKSKNILLLVSGKKKAEILAQVMNGEIDEKVPASILNTHPNVTIIADKDALAFVGGKKKRCFEDDKKELSGPNLFSVRTIY